MRPIPILLMLAVAGCSGGSNVASVSITPTTAHVPVGGNVKLTATAFDSKKAMVSTTFTWASDKGAIASVAGDGTVSGLLDGMANITATSSNGVKASAVVQVGTGGGNVLTIDKTGTGMGTITSAPSGIECGSTCVWGFAAGTMVTLTPTPSTGSYFRGWSGACSGTGPCMVTMNQDQTATAEFDTGAGPMLTVAIMGSGTGSVTSMPAGINCMSGTSTTGCASVFPSGTMVTLHAATTAGVFLGWTGGGCSGTSDCTVALTTDTQVTASMAMTHTLSVTLAGDGSGTVTSTPSGISCSSGAATGCSFDFPDTIAMVTLSEAPASGSSFAGWSVGTGTLGCSTGSTTCMFAPGSTATATFSSWSVQSAFPSVMSDMTKLGTTYIAVGSDGVIATSTSPGLPAASPVTSWTGVPSKTSATLRGVAASPSLAVAVGDNGAIVTSPDGSTWTVATSGVTANLRSVAFGTQSSSGSSFVAVGDAGTILLSADGAKWTAATSPTTMNLACVAADQNLLVAVGAGGTVIDSFDLGQTWKAQTSGTTSGLNGVAFTGPQGGAGIFVAVGAAGTVVRSSADFMTWTASTAAGASGSDLNAVAANGATLVATSALTDGSGNMQVVTSSDSGANWASGNSNAMHEHFTGIVYLGNFYALGDAGSILACSDAGVTWKYSLFPRGSVAGQANTNLYGVAFGSSTYVAVGSFGAAMTSSDGVKWTATRVTTAADTSDAIAFGNSLFAAVGNDANGKPQVLTSPDGVTWTAATISSVPATGGLVSVVYVSGTGFAAVGYQPGPTSTIIPLVVTSATGASWAAISTGTSFNGTPNSPLNSVASDGTSLVATDGAAIYTAAVGTPATWTLNATTSGMSDSLGAVAFGAGTFVALDFTTPTVTLTSTNGTGTWTRNTAAAAIQKNAGSNGFGFGNSMFLTNTLATSTNGTLWTQGALPIGASVEGMVFASGKGWVTTGAFESILTHP